MINLHATRSPLFSHKNQSPVTISRKSSISTDIAAPRPKLSSSGWAQTASTDAVDGRRPSVSLGVSILPPRPASPGTRPGVVHSALTGSTGWAYSSTPIRLRRSAHPTDGDPRIKLPASRLGAAAGGRVAQAGRHRMLRPPVERGQRSTVRANPRPVPNRCQPWPIRRRPEPLDRDHCS